MTEVKTELVSPSEVDQFTRCQTAHRFGYGQNLSRKKIAEPLQNGLAFHEIIAEYYKVIQRIQAGEPLDYDDAETAGLMCAAELLLKNKYSSAAVDLARLMFKRYIEHTNVLEWEIIAVEDYIRYQISDGVEIHGVLDLVVRVLRAPEEDKDIIGKLVIVDHKGCYNFMTRAETRMHFQVPKYIRAANQLDKYGEPIVAGILNQIRFRVDANDKVQRTLLRPTETRQINIVNEHLLVANQIIERRRLPVSEWRGVASHTAIKDVCKNCDFIDPCDAEFDGESPRTIQSIIETYYKEKDLSYRKNRDPKDGS